MASDGLKQLYRRWLLELWNGRPELAGELVTPDFLIHQRQAGPGRTEDTRGPEALKELVAQGLAPFERLRFEIEVGPLMDGEHVVARWIGRGTYAGGIPGAAAPAGTEVEFGGIDILRAEEERFAEYWVSSDGLALMAELGALGG